MNEAAKIALPEATITNVASQRRVGPAASQRAKRNPIHKQSKPAALPSTTIATLSRETTVPNNGARRTTGALMNSLESVVETSCALFTSSASANRQKLEMRRQRLR